MCESEVDKSTIVYLYIYVSGLMSVDLHGVYHFSPPCQSADRYVIACSWDAGCRGVMGVTWFKLESTQQATNGVTVEQEAWHTLLIRTCICVYDWKYKLVMYSLVDQECWIENSKSDGFTYYPSAWSQNCNLKKLIIPLYRHRFGWHFYRGKYLNV